MINMTELAVKGAALPSKLTPDPFDSRSRSSVCAQTPLSTGNGERLDLNSGTDRALLNMHKWCSPASFLKLSFENWKHFVKNSENYCRASTENYIPQKLS